MEYLFPKSRPKRSAMIHLALEFIQCGREVLMDERVEHLQKSSEHFPTRGGCAAPRAGGEGGGTYDEGDWRRSLTRGGAESRNPGQARASSVTRLIQSFSPVWTFGLDRKQTFKPEPYDRDRVCWAHPADW